MLKRKLIVLAGLLGVSLSVSAQFCRTETNIPATTPGEEFTDHGDGTVTHHKTGLMWMKCPMGQSGADCSIGTAASYTWQQALQAADGYSFAGYTDWRLPDVKELVSIVERRCISPSINAEVFPATPVEQFWSASPSAYNGIYAWYVFFNVGAARTLGSAGDAAFMLRLVRSIR